MPFRVRAMLIDVPAAGTPVEGPVATAKKFILNAPAGNAGAVFYGGADIDATHRAALQPGTSSPEFEAPLAGEIDLSDLRFDAANNGDDVELVYYDHTV